MLHDPFALATFARLAYAQADNDSWQRKLPSEAEKYGGKSTESKIIENVEVFATTLETAGRPIRVYCPRGTEPPSSLNPTEWMDFVSDLRSLRRVTLSDNRSSVGKGFWRDAEKLSEWVLYDLEKHKDHHRYFCGHSLGGAIATCLSYVVLQAGFEVHGLFTIGCPRVGNQWFAAVLEQRIELNGDVMRLVNQNDLVPRVPPGKLGFQHVGLPYYFTSSNLNRMTGTLRTPGQYGSGWWNWSDVQYARWRHAPRLRMARSAIERHSAMEYCTLVKASKLNKRD